jgi:hypothetical protein
MIGSNLTYDGLENLEQIKIARQNLKKRLVAEGREFIKKQNLERLRPQQVPTTNLPSVADIPVGSQPLDAANFKPLRELPKPPKLPTGVTTANLPPVSAAQKVRNLSDMANTRVVRFMYEHPRAYGALEGAVHGLSGAMPDVGSAIAGGLGGAITAAPTKSKALTAAGEVIGSLAKFAELQKLAAEVATKKDPELWARAKAEAKRRMGGKHSARAMQLASKIYQDRGGEYEGKEPSASQNSMKKWTKQDWQTRPGTSEIAERSDGSTSRYLPKKKWESLSKEEQVATDRKKLRADEQYVRNTEEAKVRGDADYYKKAALWAIKMAEDARLQAAGVGGYNQPKRTPGHPTKSHIVVAKDGDQIKTIRFGQQGVKTNQTAGQREAFKSRHAKNIAKGRMSAAYWADKVKWSPSKTKDKDNDNWVKGSSYTPTIIPEDAVVYSAVPDIDSVLRHGLMSSEALAKNQDLLAIARPDLEDRQAWLDKLNKQSRRLSRKGPNVFFTLPDPAKIHDKHYIKKNDLKVLEIALGKLIKDQPNTRIYGMELAPFPKEKVDKFPKRKGIIGHKKVKELLESTPEELWHHYNDPEGKTYAANVPHAAILTENGLIDPKYLKALDKG